MHLLLYPFVFFSSVVTATPILQASNDDFADWFPSFQAVNSDIINPSNLNDASENIFSNLDANVGDETLSSDSIGDWHGMSSDTLTDTFADTLGDTLSVEPQSDFSDDSGSIAFSDSPSLSQFSPNQDSSYDRSIDGALISKLIKVQATSPPACSSLIGPNSDIEFKSLCCESPCMDDQSWRRSCRSWNPSCPSDNVACCQQFNDGPDFHWMGFDCAIAPGFTFTEMDWTLLSTAYKCE